MKPFDLQRALAGDKVVTRDGREVTQLHKFDCTEDCLAGVIGGELFRWYLAGRFWKSGRLSNLDLFMAPKTVKRWVNFYKDHAYSYNCEKYAKEAASETAIAIAVPVEFEEGYGYE